MKRLKRVAGILFALLVFLLVGGIVFVLNETRDEIEATPATVQAHLDGIYNAERMAGFAVAVFSADSVLYQGGFGMANRETEQPFTPHTQLYVASIAKTLIGVALLNAQEQGLLTLDDPVNDHLPFEIANPAHPNTPITLRHLATHTSSLDYNEAVVESLYVDDAVKDSSMAAFMQAYFADGAYGAVTFTDDAPGTRWNYSNIGAGVAAYVIEVVSGQSFAAFTQTHVFDPLGLEDTGWFLTSADRMRQARYYAPTDGVLVDEPARGVQLYPARDLVTTADDLAAFGQAMMARDPRVLSRASYDELFAPHLAPEVRDRTVDNSGLFWMIDRNQYGVTYSLTGMNGGDSGINTMLWFDPVTEFGYVFLGNTGWSEQNHSNHIWALRTLVSLGDHYRMRNADLPLSTRLRYRWHNVYSRVNGLF
ncbi:MAG: serine hydrolase domain-containing protein [Rhodothermales bacterium]